MTSHIIIQRRLSVLEEALMNLEQLKALSKEEFLSDFRNYGAAERFLQIAIEVLSDIGNHVIASRNLGSVSTMNDVPRRLHEHNLISTDLSEEWIKMVGFRNIIVHDYVRLNRSIVYDVVAEKLPFIRKIAVFFTTV
jgi:uncharacterized protein YutE (UPF0331/DUF86 family)